MNLRQFIERDKGRISKTIKNLTLSFIMGAGLCSAGWAEEGNTKTNYQQNLEKKIAKSDIVWDKTFVIGNIGEPKAINADKYGNVCVAGYVWNGQEINSYDGKNYDIITMKYSPDGELLWKNNSFDSGDVDYAYGCVIDEDGSVYVGGFSFNPKKIGYEPRLLKYDKEGKIVLNKILNTPSYFTRLECMNIDSIGSVALLGQSIIGIGEQNNYKIIKYSNKGVVSEKSVAFLSEECMRDSTIMEDDQFIYTAESSVTKKKNYSFGIKKYKKKKIDIK